MKERLTGWMGSREKFILRRLLMIPISLIVLVTLSFGLIELMPGDPAAVIAGSFASEEEIADIRTELGLDDPLADRYVDYLTSIAAGDFGTSFYSAQPIRDELLTRLPATIELIGLSLFVAVSIGLFLGTIGGYYSGRAPDKFVRAGVGVIQSIPDFLLALLLIYVLFYQLGWAPPPVGQTGLGGVAVEHVTDFLLIDTLLAGDFGAFFDYLKQLWLPVISLGIVYSAYFGKIARSTMASALSSQQVEYARVCGLPERQVVRYAFLQARTPIITYLAILFGALVGGAAIVETIFSWQGAGQWALEAILQLDIPAIQGFIVAAGIITILVYLLLDVVVVYLDPRVTYE